MPCRIGPGPSRLAAHVLPSLRPRDPPASRPQGRAEQSAAAQSAWSGRTRMYSLYRSWLSRDQPPLPLPPLPPPPLPTRDPLTTLPDVVVAVGEGPSAHQFAAHRAVLSANSGYFKAALAPATCAACVSVSGVAADAFAPLLAFMYTGYLDLTRDNIYGVLLATHYLHMPRALELCWNFLRTHQHQPHTLVKPIPLPSRAKPAQAPMPWRSASPHMVLPTAEHSPFRSLQPYLPATPVVADPEPPAQDSRPDPVPEPEPHLNPAPEQAEVETGQPPPDVKSPMQSQSKPVAVGGKVVIDVACCDGPVRFHRVLNSSYGSQDDDQADPPDENQLHQGMHVPGAAQLRRARLHKAEGAGDAGEYTCLYCNHTFKSHYCYQKHARRHLNPVRQPQPQPQRAPARPLDMNVQYYPCKTCGSKFPSYYFVHKHRKLCHAGEDSDAAPSAQPTPDGDVSAPPAPLPVPAPAQSPSPS